jgi:hypothetical protein
MLFCGKTQLFTNKINLYQFHNSTEKRKSYVHFSIHLAA